MVMFSPSSSRAHTAGQKQVRLIDADCEIVERSKRTSVVVVGNGPHNGEDKEEDQ